MLRGVSFYIPDPLETIKLITNYERSFFAGDEEDIIGFNDLNKSDYLFQTIELFVMKKIVESNEHEKDQLYTLLAEIDTLVDDIYFVETQREYIETNSNRNISRDTILNDSRNISMRCFEMNIFNYDAR